MQKHTESHQDQPTTYVPLRIEYIREIAEAGGKKHTWSVQQYMPMREVCTVCFLERTPSGGCDCQ